MEKKKLMMLGVYAQREMQPRNELVCPQGLLTKRRGGSGLTA